MTKQRYLFVESYMTTESRNLGFVDSIINTVIDLKQTTKDNYYIVGYSQGHTFVKKDLCKIQSQIKHTYRIVFDDNESEDLQEIKIYAKNLAIVELILKHEFKNGTNVDIYREIPPKFIRALEIK